MTLRKLYQVFWPFQTRAIPFSNQIIILPHSPDDENLTLASVPAAMNWGTLNTAEIG